MNAALDDALVWPAAACTLCAAIVVAAGAVHALRGARDAGATFAAHTAFALDLLLAAGLLRLDSGQDLRGLGTVAAIVAVRQVIVRGIRLGAAAGAGPGRMT